MTDPERIWLECETDRGIGVVWFAAERPKYLRGSVEYVRADIEAHTRAVLRTAERDYTARIAALEAELAEARERLVEPAILDAAAHYLAKQEEAEVKAGRPEEAYVLHHIVRGLRSALDSQSEVASAERGQEDT